MKFLPVAFLVAFIAAALHAVRTLDFYMIDAEGGKSVLIVSPMLIDARWSASPNRVASRDRTVEAVKAAGLTKIDYLLSLHFDGEHIGDVPQLHRKCLTATWWIMASSIPRGRRHQHGAALHRTHNGFIRTYKPVK